MSHSCGSGGGGCGGHGEAPKDPLEEKLKVATKKIKNKLLVMSGKGGVGKSTVSVNLAVALAKRGHKVGLMDVDLHGPSVAGLLGLNDAKPEGDGKSIQPISYMENLSVLSMQNLLPNRNDAVVWRGPMKIGAIRQFLGDVDWGELDYLLVDSPPGTGDEPLTVAQDFDGIRALVVTTPQEVALADVRKSLNFCDQVALPVVGVIENMSGYVCPKCGNVDDLFGTGGGENVAGEMGVKFLGKIPLDPKVMVSGDKGKPYLLEDGESATGKAYGAILDNVEKQLAEPAKLSQRAPSEVKVETDSNGCTKFAIPIAEGVLCNHFGHCEQFAMLTVRDGKVINKSMVTPPPHEPGVLPKWIAGHGVKMIIAGGMGAHAQGLFKQYGVDVAVGAPVLAPEALVEAYLNGTLETGTNACDH